MSEIPINTQSTYVDRPEISECFADQLEAAEYDLESHVTKLVFSVKRGSTRLTACRVALPIAGLLNMQKVLTEYLAALEAQGLIRTLQISQGSSARN